MVDSNRIVLVDILASKKSARKEAHIILFEYCNLRCTFCHQDHDSTIGLDKISSKIETFIANTESDESYIVNITGGELFLDEFPDSLFEEYFAVGKRILEHFTDVQLIFGTNLVYSKVDRVVALITRLKAYGDVTLATSYDPAGRFNRTDKELFFKNIPLVADLVETLSLVITKQNIDIFLAGTEGEEFKYLYDNFPVYFDHYIPSVAYQQHQPSEDLISKLYLKLNERYPEAQPIKDWKRQRFNELTCRSTKIVNKDGVVTTCWSEAGKDSILDETQGLLAKADAEARFLEKYDCLSCEYYKRCGLRCFLHHSFVDGDTSVCKIKEMFDQILT